MDLRGFKNVDCFVLGNIYIIVYLCRGFELQFLFSVYGLLELGLFSVTPIIQEVTLWIINDIKAFPKYTYLLQSFVGVKSSKYNHNVWASRLLCYVGTQYRCVQNLMLHV